MGERCRRGFRAGWGTRRKITTVLCDRRVPPKLNGRLYKVMVRPAMLYGIEALTVTERQESKMEVAEMKMLRFSLGKTRMDKIRNEDIRKIMGVDELGRKLREIRLRWLEHVVRREEGYIGRMREVCSWEKERQTEMLGRLHQGRSEESGNGRERRVGQEQVATQDPHRRPHLKWDSSQKRRRRRKKKICWTILL